MGFCWNLTASMVSEISKVIVGGCQKRVGKGDMKEREGRKKGSGFWPEITTQSTIFLLRD